MRHRFVLWGTLVALALCTPASARRQDLSTGDARLLRFPALSQDSIAFVYAADIWTVPRTGGLARQLTTDAGVEWLPRFSPDGKWLAFTGEYDGNRDVYVMPAEGGEPKRLTWWRDVGSPSERAGPNNMVIGWTRDGRSVLFRSRHQAWEDRSGRLYTVSLEGGLPVQVGVPEGGEAAFSPDGGRLVYNRIFRNFRTWKRYRGGMTQNLWIFDLKAVAMEKLTENDNNSVDPMWVGDTIYFTSDRDKTANVFSIDLKTKQTRKLTQFSEYDVRWASDGPGGIVFENGGHIHLLDPATGKNARVSIRLPGDRRLARPEFVSVGDKIRDFHLSPEGKRALFSARGEVFTVPAEKGNTRNLTQSSGAHDRAPVWSPDGKRIAWLSDATGEYEIWLAASDGRTPPERLTTDGAVYRFGPSWSPDSKKLVFSDKDLKLFWVDVATRKVTLADRATENEIQDYTWSPDSRWLAYSKADKQGLSQVYIHRVGSDQVTRVTSEMTDSTEPVWDPNGRYLYFLSNRDLAPTFGFTEFGFINENTTRLYALTLRAELPSPFAPESDEVKTDEEEKDEAKEEKKGAKEDGKKEEDKKEPAPIVIETEGIEERIVGFPIGKGAYSNLQVNAGALFYLATPDGDGDAEGPTGELKAFDMEKRKESSLLSGIDNYNLSPDGGHLIYHAGDKYGIVEAKAGETAKVGDGELKLDGMTMRLDHRAEWKQMFDEVWRLQRDFFYVKNMHGVDWQKMKQRYGELVPWVAHRSDLTYILGEMIGELNAGHAYVGGGEAPGAKSTPLALLGADYALDAASGRYRISRVLLGQNWDARRRSPLTEPGVAVAEGSYILTIDGVDLKAPATPDALLENAVGRTVTLLVNDKPRAEGAREVVVKPIADEESLRYFDRIERNRRAVDKATGGTVGYLHLPDMGTDGLNEFVRQYYPQIRKQGLIVDVRNNGGGFVSQIILERLRRVLMGMNNSRNSGPTTYPAQVFNGPMVCLINHYSASDGDIFPYFFRKYGLGPLIGTRTWGGVVGIRGLRPLLDGGYITLPEFGEYDLESRWAIEGHGVDPDIELDNRDDLVMKGHDPQLEKGIQMVLEEIGKKPRPLPPVPPDPIKN